MDPITQGAFGATFAQLNRSRVSLGKAALIGALAGMSPDLDILIRSKSDPLLALEYHRHFTHSLFFIPIGAFICACTFYFVFAKRWGLRFYQVFLCSLIGYATHALLDGCTSYGTQLLWPFSDRRFAWDTISVIDPLVTLPLLVFIYLAIRKGRFFTYLGLGWMALYFICAEIQHLRALDFGHKLAKERVGEYKNLQAKPSFANIWVWKVIYETDQSYFVEAVRPGLGSYRSWRGASINKLDLERDLPWLDKQSQQARDIERFRWFSDGFIAIDPNHPQRIIDIRYSMLPHEIAALWGIELSNTASEDEHVQYVTTRERSDEAFVTLWKMIKGVKKLE